MPTCCAPGRRNGVLPFRVMAPSTLGTFLRAFTFGHVRQLDAVIAETLRRAWTAGAGPGNGRLVIDVDSTICEVHGKHKHGAGYGYTHVLGYHPIVATRAETGEVLHARMRKGQANTSRGARRFIEELIARVRRAGATGEIVAAGRFGVLVQGHDRDARSARGALHDGGPHRKHCDRTGDRHDRRDGVGRHRLHARRRGPSRRMHLPWSASDRASHPPHRHHPSDVVARLASPRVPHRPRRRHRHRSTSSIDNTPSSNSRSVTSKKVPGSNTARPASSSRTPPGSPARCSPTTSSAGAPTSVTSPPTISSPSRAPSAPDSSRCPAGS